MTDPLNNLPDDDASLDLPASLKTKLRDAHQPTSPTSAQWARVDRAVFEQATLHFSKESQRGAVAGRIGRLSAMAAGFAAAAVALVIWMNSGHVHQQPNQQPLASSDNSSQPRAPLPGDVNSDGQLDILDAYLLQRRIETAATLETAWDLTRDDKVDAQDVSAIAAESVKLQGGPRL